MRDFRQRHAAFRSSSFEQSEGRGSGAAAAGNGASSSSLQTPAQAAESLLVVLGRLRLLAPRLRLRLGKSEAAGGPFGYLQRYIISERAIRHETNRPHRPVTYL